jgi:hypothetical protein
VQRICIGYNYASLFRVEEILRISNFGRCNVLDQVNTNLYVATSSCALYVPTAVKLVHCRTMGNESLHYCDCGVDICYRCDGILASFKVFRITTFSFE